MLIDMINQKKKKYKKKERKWYKTKLKYEVLILNNFSSQVHKCLKDKNYENCPMSTSIKI